MIVDNALLEDKDIKSIIRDCQALTGPRRWPNSCDDVALFVAEKFVNTLKTDTFDSLWSLLRHIGSSQAAGNLALAYHSEHPTDFVGHLRMGDSLTRSKFAKRAMFHYA